MHSHDHDHHSAQEADQHWRTDAILVGACGGLLLVGWITEYIASLAWIAVWLYAISATISGIPTLFSTARSLWNRTLDVDLLMLLGALGAASIGYVNEAAVLLFLFLLSHVLETFAMGRTRRALKGLMELRPETAEVLRDGEWKTVQVDDIQVGEQISVHPGDRIPLDGVLREGEANLDESALTGEAIPVWKNPGEQVLAGSINLSGALQIETTKTAGQSTLARMVELVEQARGSRAPTQRLLDRFTVFYVIVVLGSAAVTALVPPVLGWAEWELMFYKAMTLLVVASPCALVISTPATVLSAIAAAAWRGVLFKGGTAVETLGSARILAFDKTGTLTDGKLQVVQVESLGESTEHEVLALAAAIEQGSEHPLAQAIVRAAEEADLPLPQVDHFQASSGLGVEAQIEGQPLLVGNLRFLEANRVQVPSEFRKLKAGAKRVWVARSGELVGWISFSDQLRPEVRQVIPELKKLGFERIVMLTGDEPEVAEPVAKEAGVDEFHAGLLPPEKVEWIQQLSKSNGSGRSGTVMIGDGVNDAPALAAADIGIAMGAAGTDLTIESAEVVLMSSDLRRLVDAVAISHQSRRLLWQNLGFASSLIVILVCWALFGNLALSLGVVAHEGSTVLVILNGLRLLAYRPVDLPVEQPSPQEEPALENTPA